MSTDTFRRVRAAAGWSQERMAEALGVSRAAVYNYEHDTRRRCDTRVAYRLLDIAADHGIELSLEDVYPREPHAPAGSATVPGSIAASATEAA